MRDGTETITKSRIQFRPKVSDHEREVICRAENTNIPISAIEASHRLTIHCKYNYFFFAVFKTRILLRSPPNTYLVGLFLTFSIRTTLRKLNEGCIKI